MRPTKSSHSFEVLGRQVKFSSNFDSGNLRTVTQIGIYEFMVESSLDTYQIQASNKSFFHFKVENYPIGEPLRIVIKKLSLLECIKPERRIYYKPCFSYNGQRYQRLPENSSVIKQRTEGLDLEINFVMDKNLVYFAFSLPYSYQRYLNMIRDLPDSSPDFYIKKQVLCYSKNLHLVYMITITSFDRRTNQSDVIGSSTNGVILPEKHLDQERIYFDKPVILLSARVHPGQTPSSWAMEGIIKYLVQNSEEAKILRKNFLIVIVPMLNPDGVFEGMYRLDTQGHNLNRYYLVSDNRQPSIYSMKHLIKHYHSTKRLLFYLDFHGHPSFKGSFLYGNAIDDIAYQAETQLFGRIMALNCETFEQKYCIFDREQMSSKDRYDMYTKQGCARVYAFKTANILHSYTVQMGFHGCTSFPESSSKKIESFYYTEQDYYKEGIAVLSSIIQASGLKKNGIEKQRLRKQIALQIVSREQRFRKQDKNISIKKKNVNQILQNEYWSPIRQKFFKPHPEKPSQKIRRIVNKKIISRTSFISTSILKNEQQQQYIQTIKKSKMQNCKQQSQQQQKHREKYKQKLNTQSYDLIEQNTISQKYKENKKKKLQMRHMIFSTKNKQSSFSRKEEGTVKKAEQRKISIDKFIDKPKRSQIKILSGRTKYLDPSSYTIKPLAEHFEQFMFNDLNLRKGTSDLTINDTKNGYCIVSADKISSRFEQLKQMFRPDKNRQISNSFQNQRGSKKSSSFMI